jgi:hypothetical protein
MHVQIGFTKVSDGGQQKKMGIAGDVSTTVRCEIIP